MVTTNPSNFGLFFIGFLRLLLYVCVPFTVIYSILYPIPTESILDRNRYWIRINTGSESNCIGLNRFISS